MRALAVRLLVLAVILGVTGLPAGSRAGMPAASTLAAPAAAEAPGTLTSSVVVFADPGEVTSAEQGGTSAERYLVAFRDRVDDPLKTTLALADELGFRPTHVYRARFRGFAARLTSEAVTALRNDPAIDAIYADEVFTHSAINDNVYRIGGFRNATAKIDGIDGPNGSGERVNADVAIVDGGVSRHPDLNIAGGFDCTGNNAPYHDDDGHGTHVAGIVGALDNGVGSVGVAPGARIYPVRVFVYDEATTAALVCAMETIADHTDLFEVANMSFRHYGADGSCKSDPFHQAICDVTNAGVTLVAAAGNDVDDAANWVPAAYNQVITVSAYVDSDGLPGGLGPSTDRGRDDQFANFSNYGADVDIAAPGVQVISTWPSNLPSRISLKGYNYLSGTSMAAPAVTGAVALLMAKNGHLSPAEAKRQLLAAAIPAALPGDPDGIHEPLLNVGDVTPSLALSRRSGAYHDVVGATMTGFLPGEAITLQVGSGAGATVLKRLTADATGAVATSFRVPSMKRGTNRIVALGAAHEAGAVNFKVLPSATLSPGAGPPGTRVTVRARGFAAGVKVDVVWTSGKTAKVVSSGTTSSAGSSTRTVSVPSGTKSGSYTISVTERPSGVSASAPFAVTKDTPTPTPTATAKPTRTPTVTPTASPTASENATATPSLSPTATATDTATATETATATATDTPMPPEPVGAAATEPATATVENG